MHRICDCKSKAVGVRQTTKAIQQGKAAEVFLAVDAPRVLTDPIAQLCAQKGVALYWVDSMKQLGEDCSIKVGAAAAAALIE